MAKNSLSNFWSSLKEAPNQAAKYAPKIKEVGVSGMEYIQTFFEINALKGKNAKQDLTIDAYYYKLGKIFYEHKISSSDTNIKNLVAKIKNCNAEKEKNNIKIKTLEAKLNGAASQKEHKQLSTTKKKKSATKVKKTKSSKK